MVLPQHPERATEAVDRVTGLPARDGFARAVDRADQDRDRMMVAVVAVDGLAEVNHLCGHHAGDDLLRAIGRVLADRTSVDMTAARLGGSHFGVLWAPAGDRLPDEVLGPILDDLNQAVRRWADQRAALGTPSPVRPIPLTGSATGFDGRAWAEAETALGATVSDRSGAAVTHFDPDLPRLAEHRRRQRLLGELGDAIDQERLPIATAPIDALSDRLVSPGDRPAGPGEGGRWVRLGLHLPNAGRADDHLAPGGVSPAELAAAPGLAGEIDRRLLDHASDLLTGAPTSAEPAPERVTVPLLGPLLGRRSAIGAWPSWPSWPPGIVLEIDQARLIELGPSAGTDLVRRLNDLGWELTVAGFDGGLAAWAAVERFRIDHLLIADGLIAGTGTDTSGGIGAASRLLATTVATAAASDRRLMANDDMLPDDVLAGLGFDLVARPLQPRV